MYAIVFPNINPISFTIFNFDIYWYSFAYILGFVLGYLLFNHLNKKQKQILSPSACEDCLFYCVIGLIIGARAAAVLIFDFERFIANPLLLFAIRKGGMSFHGGLVGMACAIYFLSRKYKINFFIITDLIVCVAPIGLFLGRIANFINAEVYGRVTDVSWAVIFPHSDMMPRHPSQLYEAGLEGILLFIIMLLFFYKTSWRNYPGKLSGLFLFSYGLLRSFAEIFREPDAPGLILQYFTMGQILSFPMIIFGAYLLIRKS
jgi:phosphatidylglycerol:prolipoprotein diacylglycerol transferase